MVTVSPGSAAVVVAPLVTVGLLGTGLLTCTVCQQAWSHTATLRSIRQTPAVHIISFREQPQQRDHAQWLPSA